MSIPRAQWEWFGYPGHFIEADRCLFRLCTVVGKYLISTVGDKHDIGTGERVPICSYQSGFFETYVFQAGPRCDTPECGCGQPEIDGHNIDGERCATAGEAQALHLKYCEKYARRKA